MKPLGVMRSSLMSNVTMVTTAEFLADPMSQEMADAYAGHHFVYVGPLLDKPGAKRAGAHKFNAQQAHDHVQSVGHESDTKALILTRDARAEGRKVVLVSLGTMITGDHPDHGWNAHLVINGEPVGISGRQLCQAAWQAAFDVFGDQSASVDAPLILVALGPQADALEGLHVPPNAFCAQMLPQVDLLRLGVDVFLTHGGQNSFMEALSIGVPVVVCPGFADQPVNAAKAESLQIGKKVDRPMRGLKHTAADVTAYRTAAADALRDVTTSPSFKESAKKCAQALRASGGVSQATKVLLSLARSNLPHLVKMAGA